MSKKQYFENLNKEAKRLIGVKLESVKALQMYAMKLEETFVGGVNDMDRYEQVAKSFQSQFEELKDIVKNLEQFNIIDEGNLVRDGHELAMEYQESLDEDYEDLQTAIEEFESNAQALGVDPNEVDAYKEAKDALGKYGAVKFGDNIGWIVEPYMDLQSSEYQKILKFVK